jgi:cyclomaltodextrinase / maltogenic alpha-amylase / neopullulanase
MGHQGNKGNKLLIIRQEEKSLKYGNFKQIYLEYQRPFVFERSFENERIIIVVNIANREDTINLNVNNYCKFFDLLQKEVVFPSNNIYMKPFSVKILKEEKME